MTLLQSQCTFKLTLCNIVSICFSNLVSSAVGLLVDETAKLEYLDKSELVWFSNETACDLIDENEDIVPFAVLTLINCVTMFNCSLVFVFDQSIPNTYLLNFLDQCVLRCTQGFLVCSAYILNCSEPSRAHLRVNSSTHLA